MTFGRYRAVRPALSQNKIVGLVGVIVIIVGGGGFGDPDAQVLMADPPPSLSITTTGTL